MSYQPSDALIERIQIDALQRLFFKNFKESDMFIQRDVLPRGTIIQPERQPIVIEENTVMVFVDQAPAFNWSHPCEYMLYQADSGDLYKSESAMLPPYLTETPETFQLFHKSLTDEVQSLDERLDMATEITAVNTTGERYALLFSGCSYYRHVNDLEFLYRTLLDVYQYSEDNIYVLNYDGTINYSRAPQSVGNWPGDSTPYRMKVKGKGTKSDLDDVFDELKNRLATADSLLIHTNNHGWYNKTESLLCAYSGPDYTASDFAVKLAQLPPFQALIVMMEQCNSGGFNAGIVAHSPASLTSVAAACEETKSSMGGAHFDPFARDWVAAMHGTNPNGTALAFDPDIDGKGCVTAHEAFGFAQAIKDPYDTPQYAQSSPEAGKFILRQ